LIVADWRRKKMKKKAEANKQNGTSTHQHASARISTQQHAYQHVTANTLGSQQQKS
jgi:hypothetical protein